MKVSRAIQSPIRTIRLPAERIKEILDGLETKGVVAKSRRQEPRYDYRFREIVVHMNPSKLSEPLAFLVPTRNISAHGVAFLYGAFVHPGTACVIQLVTRHGERSNVAGAIRRCRHIEGNVHEIFMQFKEPIDPVLFCSPATR